MIDYSVVVTFRYNKVGSEGTSEINRLSAEVLGDIPDLLGEGKYDIQIKRKKKKSDE